MAALAEKSRRDRERDLETLAHDYAEADMQHRALHDEIEELLSFELHGHYQHTLEGQDRISRLKLEKACWKRKREELAAALERQGGSKP